jgi:translation initiation factor 4A
MSLSTDSNDMAKVSGEEVDEHKDVHQETEEIDDTDYSNVVARSFDEMNLSEDLLRGIYCYGFERPSYIQQRAIIPLYKGKDLIAQSQSGTGKTGTFLIGSVQKVNRNLNKTQVLILSPTRELSQQIFQVLSAFTNSIDISKYLLIGGKNISQDFSQLDKGVQMVVGTPGRVYDMLKRYVLRTDHIHLVVLDEADEMLSRGFKDQIYEIFQYIPKSSQVALFSATMPPEALDITKRFMKDPIEILVKNEELTLEGIKQYYVAVECENWKFDTLCDLYSNFSVSQTIIYCNSKRKADWIKDRLIANGFTVECIHGDMRQKEREEILQGFRAGTHRILLATDIIARGIDVQQVSLVINFDMPRYREVYIHRIGRSGRFGRKGVAINFVTKEDNRVLRDIEQFYTTQVEELPANIGDLIGCS